MKAYEIEKDEKEFEEYLNDCYPSVNICGIEMDQGTILKKCDPIAFRCALSYEPIKYGCSECDSEYDDEDEANDCCNNEVVENE